MVKIFKKLLPLFFVFTVFISFPNNVNAADQKLYDNAELLTSEQSQEIQDLALTTSERIGMDIVIVTTNDDEGKSPTQYAEDFYFNNSFGYGEYKDGIILYINMTTRDIEIRTIGNLRKYIDDQNWVILRDDVTPYLSDGDYYTAFQTFISETENYINAGIPNYKYVYDPETGKNIINTQYRDYEAIYIALGAALVAIIITIAVIVRRYKFHFIPTALNYVDKNDTYFKEKTDTFLTEHTSCVKIETSSSGGGGFSGGSSGGSSGGGGGKF